MRPHTLSRCFGALFVIALAWAVSAGAADIAQGPYQPDWPSLQAHTAAPEWFRRREVRHLLPLGGVFRAGLRQRVVSAQHAPKRRTGIPLSRGHLRRSGRIRLPRLCAHVHSRTFSTRKPGRISSRRRARVSPVPWRNTTTASPCGPATLTPWNAGDKGPKRDIMGELAEAVRARGMRLVATFHHARKQPAHGQPGRQARVGRPLSARRRLAYGLPTTPSCGCSTETCPGASSLTCGRASLSRPSTDISRTSSGSIPGSTKSPRTYQCEFLAHYLNRAAEWDKDVVVTCKQRDLPIEIVVEDFEKGRTDRLTEEIWLTDDTISYGSWCYTQNLRIKPLRDVLHVLIDIVSKNGQLLLNISPMADGTIPEDQQKVLLGIGQWLDKFGEAIYGTRPFLTFGEGPTRLDKGGHFVKARLKYTPEDIRFTRKGNTVYAIVLGWPGAGKSVTMETFGEQRAAKDVTVADVALLGADTDVKWEQTDKGLVVKCPKREVDDLAIVFKLETRGLPPAP